MAELTSTFDQRKMLDGLVGCELKQQLGWDSATASGLEGGSTDGQRVHVPLQFSF